jgi:hypothetical protein
MRREKSTRTQINNKQQNSVTVGQSNSFSFFIHYKRFSEYTLHLSHEPLVFISLFVIISAGRR